MAQTDITAINAQTISIAGVPISGSGVPSGPVTTFDVLDADAALALNGVLRSGSLPPGGVYTNFTDINILVRLSVADIPYSDVLTNYRGVAAIYDQNTTSGLYYANGTVYPSFPSMVTALGGTSSGITAIVGPYTDPNAPNLLSNGTFDTATTGWTASGSGTITIVSGQIQLTVNANADAFSQPITGYYGRAINFTGTGARGTNTTNSPSAAMGQSNAALGGNVIIASPVANTTQTPFSLTRATNYSGSMWLGVRGTTGTGTTLWDNFVARESSPMPGWQTVATSAGTVAPTWGVLLDATTPAALPTTGNVKVLWQADTGSETVDRIRVHWDATGHVHMMVTTDGGALFDFDLGAIAASTGFKVALTAAQGVNSDPTTGYAASINGTPSQTLYTSATPMVGVSQMRIGKDSAGASLWDSTTNRIAVVPGRQPTDWLEYRSAPATANPFWEEGDSYMDGAGGVQLKIKLAAALGRIGINSAVGGATFGPNQGGGTNNISDRIMARPYLRALPLVIWDGSNNGMVDVPSQVAIAQGIWNWKGDGRILFIPSLAVPNPGAASSSAQSAQATLLAQYRDALIAAFGAAHVWSAVPTLQALATSSTDDQNDVAAGLIPRSIMLDQTNGQVHLGDAAMSAVANAPTLLAKIAAL